VNTTIEEIPLSKFDLSLSGIRIMNQFRILQVEKLMRLYGQLQPVVAREYEGNYQIIDGFKRFYAAEDLMMETLQCRILKIDLSQAKVLLLSYNRPHRSMEAWEEAVVLKDLLETHNLDQQRLAKLTGYSRSWVSRRLSLIGKMDEEITSEIMMGVLTGSHARALIKLPRGNQCEVARAITTYGLTSRQSNTLVDAFLEAKDENRQRYVLTHPEKVLEKKKPEAKKEFYDARLSCYGNDLMKSMMYVIHSVPFLLSRLNDQRIGKLSETERVIIIPGFKKVSGYAEKLTEAIGHLQIT
jgi:ParB/RepB/Spo0J family partition protein